MIQKSKTVHIKVRTANSSYAYANKKVLDEIQINRTIGSSVSSVNKMLANSDEQKAIMGSIISISPNSSNWETKLKNYWDSFTEEIPESGKKLEVGFVYDIDSLSKKDYIDNINKSIENKEDKLSKDEDLIAYIDDRLNTVHEQFKQAIKAASGVKNVVEQEKLVKSAYRIKYDSIWTIESERYKIGNPIDPFEYMLYKYCLVYGDVANEKVLVSNSPKIRFYLQSDEDIVKERKTQLNKERKRTMLLSSVINSVENMQNLLYAMGETNIPDDDEELFGLVDSISKSRESEFIAIAGDKNLAIIGEIEKYIAYGILSRANGSTVIYDPIDLDKPIANNIEEAVMYFNNQANKAKISELKNKFKNLGK